MGHLPVHVADARGGSEPLGLAQSPEGLAVLSPPGPPGSDRYEGGGRRHGVIWLLREDA